MFQLRGSTGTERYAVHTGQRTRKHPVRIGKNPSATREHTMGDDGISTQIAGGKRPTYKSD
jgi:hypothetical protein